MKNANATQNTAAKTIDQILTDIASTELDIATLETRNSDSLDFHEVSAAGLKRALLAAFKAGQAAK